MYFWRVYFNILNFLINSIMARGLTKEQVISNIYYDVEDGFGSIQATLKQAKQKDPTISKEDVEKLMRQQPNKQVKKYRGTNSYTAPFARFEYQIDIMDMVPLTKEPEVKIPRKNDQPRYALVVIDIFSKLANVIPMKEKNSESVLSALKESFRKMGTPMSIYSDNDGAFMSVVKEFLDGEGIIQHTTTLTHANVAERFIRTIKNMIHDRVRFNKADWTSMLTPSLNKYNNTKHSSTELTPKEAHKDTNHLKVGVNLTLKEKNRRKYPPINEDDNVKIYEKKRGNYTDRKETNPKWSKRSFKVVDIKRDMMGNRTFKLAGLTRPYLRHEILLV